MLFSEDRIYHIAHLLTDSIWKDDMVDYKDEDKAVREARKVLIDYFSKDDKVDKIARDRIASLKRGVYEGSREWDILYSKYYEEEMKKLL
ncbi:MAG: DUF507 family protein [Pseudomonadota bacterium]